MLPLCLCVCVCNCIHRVNSRHAQRPKGQYELHGQWANHVNVIVIKGPRERITCSSDNDYQSGSAALKPAKRPANAINKITFAAAHRRKRTRTHVGCLHVCKPSLNPAHRTDGSTARWTTGEDAETNEQAGQAGQAASTSASGKWS